MSGLRTQWKAKTPPAGKVGYEYSDRLFQRDSDKFDRVHREIFGDTSNMWYNANPKLTEKFLSAFLDHPVKLVKIEHGKTPAQHPYWVFGFIDKHVA